MKLTSPIYTGDDEQTAAIDLQIYATEQGWGGVDPLTQQRVRFRETMREAVVQKRGGFFFAVAFGSDGRPYGAGPAPFRDQAAREAIEASLTNA